MARHSESEEWLVVYQALYGERGFWLRPLSLWLEPVTRSNIEGSTDDDSDPVQRFTLLQTNTRSLQSVTEPG